MALVKHRPAELLSPPAQRRALDFRKDVLTLMRSRCAACHSGKSPSGGFKLAASAAGPFNGAYRQLLAPRPAHGEGILRANAIVIPGNARQSLLSQIIGAVQASRPGATDHPSVPLNDDERRIIVQWIDLGARWEN